MGKDAPYILRCTESDCQTVDHPIFAHSDIGAMLVGGKRLLQLWRLGRCKKYELLDPKGNPVKAFEEIMESDGCR